MRTTTTSTALTGFAAMGLSAILLAACSGDGGSEAGGGSNPPAVQKLRIYHSPYRATDWAADLRLKAQHHDHPGHSDVRLQTYNDAGYDVVPLMDYSGAPQLPYALTLRLWPPEKYVSPAQRARYGNIKFFLPNAEEVGDVNHHMTSPFMTKYIEHSDAAPDISSPGAYQYANITQEVALIRANGGLPIYAHPWYSSSYFLDLPEPFGREIYNAFAEAKREAGDPSYTGDDRNRMLLNNWDASLARGRRLVGIAVNDHFGPDTREISVSERVRDSGKIIVLSKAATLDAYRNSFEQGAILAVRDFGVPKDHFPQIASISLEATSILINAGPGDSVTWISMGQVVGRDPLLHFSALPQNAVYLRAEISNAESSVVYTQAFTVRPVGDANGDGIVDGADRAICDAVTRGTEKDPDRVSACT